MKNLCEIAKQIALVTQCAKKVITDSQGLVDFVAGLVDSITCLPDSKVPDRNYF